MRISSIFYFKYNTFSRRYLVPILAVSRCPISPLIPFLIVLQTETLFLGLSKTEMIVCNFSFLLNSVYKAKPGMLPCVTQSSIPGLHTESVAGMICL